MFNDHDLLEFLLVARISEAQRFTALTLAERADAKTGAKRIGERVITPH